MIVVLFLPHFDDANIEKVFNIMSYKVAFCEIFLIPTGRLSPPHSVILNGMKWSEGYRTVMLVTVGVCTILQGVYTAAAKSKKRHSEVA